MTDQELIEEIQAQKALMLSVATGGPQIRTVTAEYIARRTIISSALTKRRTEDPNPFGDLWAWYGRWSKGDLPTWQSRRDFLSALYDPLVARVQGAGEASVRLPEPTGWARVDRGIEKIHTMLSTATHEEDWQSIGLLCREVLISLGNAVFDTALHLPSDGVSPSSTDALRMLEAFLRTELPGGPNAELRAHAKASLALAVALQHRRTANSLQASLCVEATTSIVNVVRLVSGQESHSSTSGKELPFCIPSISDAELQRIEGYHSTAGSTTVIARLEERDIRIADGWEPANYPNSRREVWIGYHDGRYEHILMKRPRS